MCAAKIFGLEILNEGFGISIDHAVSEMQATFKTRSPLRFSYAPPSESATDRDPSIPINPARCCHLLYIHSWLNSSIFQTPAHALLSMIRKLHRPALFPALPSAPRV